MGRMKVDKVSGKNQGRPLAEAGLVKEWDLWLKYFWCQNFMTVKGKGKISNTI